MAQAAKSPETNQKLVDIGKIVIQNAGCFTQDLRTLNSKDAGDINWENFQTHFREAQQEIEAAQPTSSAMGFNRANIAQETSKICIQ